MDRLHEKLTKAAGVAPRMTVAIEAEADALIAREEDMKDRTKQAFAPHHALLDSQVKELNTLEDALQIVENANPLSVTGDTEARKREQHLAAVAAALTPGDTDTLHPGSTASIEPGTRRDAGEVRVPLQ